MKKCPFCTQDIRSEAIKCRHCKAMLTDSAKAIGSKRRFVCTFHDESHKKQEKYFQAYDESQIEEYLLRKGCEPLDWEEKDLPDVTPVDISAGASVGSSHGPSFECNGTLGKEPQESGGVAGAESKMCSFCNERNHPQLTSCWKCKEPFLQPAFKVGAETAVSRGDVGTKKCPHCAELVRAEAIKCKHCGEKLDRSSSDNANGYLRAFAIHGRYKGMRRMVYLKAISEEALRAEQLSDWEEISSIKEIKHLPCRNCPNGFMLEGQRGKFNPWGILYILITVVVYQVSLGIFAVILGPLGLFVALTVTVIYNIWAWSTLSKTQKTWKCGYCNTSIDQGPQDTISLSL